jgi:thioredoxin reductase/Pyruvate/2-oxoacid:ferredoxin oxidoreductase delta subunit
MRTRPASTDLLPLCARLCDHWRAREKEPRKRHGARIEIAMADFNTFAIALYGVPLAAIVIAYVMRHRRREAAHARMRDEAIKSGMTEPASLHPAVDPLRCIGSGSCVKACPERALGVVGGKATLADPAACIGHGACAAACPVDAITLVLGTERRGIDIPRVSPDFETNVPGIFIAGELGGMGLIRKASEQGRQAMRAIARRPRTSAPLDVVIVGAGPAGIAAGLSALEQRLRYVLIEQEDDLGGAVFHYPRRKVAMTAPVDLPIVGKVRFGEVSKEKLLAFWQDIVARTGLSISFGDRMEKIEPVEGGYRVRTTRASYHARAVLLAIGRRGTPRKLDVPGEELPKVVYRLIDAEQYRGCKVLVVGGGDSAVEAALACAEQPGTEVALSYRGDAFNRIKPRNRERLDQAQAQARLRVILNSEVRRISAPQVELVQKDDRLSLANDAVIVQVGGVLPTALLKGIGVAVETKFGTA